MDVIADRYELGRTLGTGGMARVVEAHDRVLDRTVAVKLLREDIATDPLVRERFLGEARTAARFTHANAVTVFDTGIDGRVPWIVMELIEGEDLSERLARTGPFEEAQAVAITGAVLAALDAAHRGGFVHRDIKPGNIMLLDDGRVKLADFGIAKGLQETAAGLTATGQIIGTAKYLSPEQVDGQPASPASDVYAMGCVLYEMLVGQPPFTGESPIAIALAHTRDAVPDIRRERPDVSAAVAGVVTRSLAKDPATRFADAGEMRRALRGDQAAAAATTVLLPENEATQVLPAGPRRRPVPWALIALAIVAVLGALWLVSLLDEPPADVVSNEPSDEPAAAASDEQPAEPTQQPTQDPTEAVSEPPDAPVVPTDLESLEDLLAVQPDVYGEAQESLRKELEGVLKEEGDKQAEKAAKLQDQISGWVDSGELDPNIGNLAFALLEPLASTFDDGSGEGGPPPGKGKGKGKENGNGDG